MLTVVWSVGLRNVFTLGPTFASYVVANKATSL